MSLRTVSFQDTYWSGENDLIKEFYVPCMEDSIEYYRAVGYFNSSILCYITNGLYPFIQNGGRMRIVCSVNLSPEDERQIALGYDIRQLMEDKIDPVIQNLIDLNIANIKNLCWLIKNNRLDIKVCLRKDPNDPGTYHLFHEKFGIFKDADGNAISFLGSVNETLGGWINNEESFEVSQNWIPVLQAFIQEHLVTDDAILVEKERRALFNACAQYQPHGFQTRAAYFSLSEEIWKKEKERSAKKEEFEHLRKDIGSFNEEAGERIIQDIANMEVKKQEAEIRRTKTQVLFEQDQEKLAQLEEKLAELSQLDKEGALCQKKLENTIVLEKIFSVYRNRLLEEKRAFVEKYATEVFLQITNAPQKYKGIKIASDYSLLLELMNGETYQIEPGRTLNPSTGQSKVISLSYIAGLNRSSDFAAPVIIDNPLGLFSDEHRAAITRFLPHMGKQVIFMVSTGDLTEKYQNELKPYVKTVYKLENHSDQTWPKTVIASKEVY